MRRFQKHSLVVARVAAGLLLAVLALSLRQAAHVVSAQTTAPPTAQQQLARDILKELIEIDTTDEHGNVTRAAEAMAARLRAAGFPSEDVQVIGPNPRKGNLVARLRGTGARRPVLLLAHLDVVEARREDWTFDPFKLTEQDGYFYGRGTLDIKEGAANLVANLIRLKRENFKPDRDLILALTADEEGGNFNGVDWLLRNHRDLIDAEFCINTDAGGGALKDGKPQRFSVQASEKIYLSFRLEVKNPGGHSSLPTRDNAIYHLAEGLARLARFDFPVRLNEVTRTYFERAAALEAGQLAADMRAVTHAPPDPAAVSRLSATPYFNALMRTTCVATRLEAGHADNALPQTAAALVNCRLLPDESPDEVERTLARVVADPQVKITRANEPRPAPLSPLKPEIMRPVERIAAEMWPGAPTIPVMETGATDGLLLRRAGLDTYGITGLFIDINDVRAHGKDERIGVKEFYDDTEFLYRLIKAVSSNS
jgi:acetylornithine deacetylase/succinyl-diaminopimelate desuccinylase-like protein